MKIPVSPPHLTSLLQSLTRSNPELIFELLKPESLTADNKGRYLHWDRLRHLPLINYQSHEHWWLSIKLTRKGLYKSLPFIATDSNPFQFSMPDQIYRECHWLDRYAAGAIQASEAITNTQTRHTYLIRSLIEEAINSSQLEGASTTRNEAKEMIRQDRAPQDKSERMILNNYLAMQFIRDNKDEALTPSIVFELHRIITKDTIDDDEIGRFRSANETIHVIDNKTQQSLYTPPPAQQLETRLQKLCDFANLGLQSQNKESFLHPAIQAITLHFMLAYDHPFCDGNGRTARALFYWAMAKQGYWLMEFISISRVIKKASSQYGKAFLYTETDDNDLTYFLIHQLDVIHQAVDDLHVFLHDKMQGIKETERLLVDNPKLQGKLNFRQLALLRHALKHPRFSYAVQEHQRTHGISYDVARKDLLQMADQLKLLIKTKQGRSYYFVAPNDLEKRISA